jgi:hypothetical protein
VSGDIREIPFATAGNWLNGMKMPLINIKGNLIKVLNIWIGAGVLVAGIEKMRAIEEKQRELRTIPASRTTGCVNETPSARATATGMIVTTRPVSAEASMSPRRMVQTDTGQDANLSRVLEVDSTGKMIGDIAEQVKKTVMPIRPGIRESTDICLPTAKERNINPGQSKPIRMTCPLA